MKKFLKKIISFSGIMFVLFIVGMLLPPTPKAKRFVLFSKIQKDSLLQNVKSPRIIFVGGSNIMFGLNSQLIKDSLGLNPINVSLTATVGLQYMMDNTLSYIKPNDIVVLMPEYQHYFGSFANGNQGLLRLLLDVDKSGFAHLNMDQWLNVAKRSPEFFISKFDPNEYFDIKKGSTYENNIFNEYGDSDAHWTMKKKSFDPDDFTNRELNKTIFDEMIKFEKELVGLGASLFVSYPCFQKTSYEINKDEIELVEKQLIKNNFKILGTAQRYQMSDSLMFDTPYHLIKSGVDLRTELLIEDIKNKSPFNKTY